MQERERLHRFAKAHVIGQHTRHADFVQVLKPRQPVQLIWTQRRLKADRRAHCGELRAIGDGRAHRQPTRIIAAEVAHRGRGQVRQHRRLQS